MERETGALEPVDAEAVPDRPRVVDEAHEVLTSYAWQLVITGAAGSALWGLALASGIVFGLPWLITFLLALLVLFFRPVTREPRLARDVLRKWDDRRVERALESAGVSNDPRLEVAESMAHRVIRHPSVDERGRAAAAAAVRRLQRLLQDLRRVEYLAQARVAMDRAEDSRSISDLQDLLDARIAEVLGQLAALHHTVVLRDERALARVVDGIEELVRELEAEREVERLLSSAERG